MLTVSRISRFDGYYYVGGNSFQSDERTLYTKKSLCLEAVAWYWHFVDVVWIGLFISFTGFNANPNRRSIGPIRPRR